MKTLTHTEEIIKRKYQVTSNIFQIIEEREEKEQAERIQQNGQCN